MSPRILVPESAHLGLCWAHVEPQKFQTQKDKCWEFMFGHFGAHVEASWAMLERHLGVAGSHVEPCVLLRLRYVVCARCWLCCLSAVLSSVFVVLFLCLCVLFMFMLFVVGSFQSVSWNFDF